MHKSNVVDLTKRLKKTSKNVAKKDYAAKSETAEIAKVLNLRTHQSKKEDDERRKVTRTVLSQFIGVFVALKSGVLQPVSVHDISVHGMAFDMVQDMGAFNIGEFITLRIYISHDTYFSFGLQIANTRVVDELGVCRHGGKFKKGQDVAGEALYHFVRFLQTVATVAKKDRGDKVSGRVD